MVRHADDAPFGLTADQREFANSIREVARTKLRPVAGAGTPGRVNRPLVRALAEHGLLARLFPTAAMDVPAGAVSAVELCILRENLAMECTEAETALALQGLGTYPILQSGRPEIVRRWIPAVAEGAAVAAFALTEPDAGSDVAGLQLVAERDGQGWRLSGEKIYISNAPDADVYTVFARTTSGRGSRGISAFVVEGTASGLSGGALELVAPHPIGRLQFDGVHVPHEHLLGEVDGGFAVAMRTFDLFRPSVGAFAVGMAEAALAAAVTHAGSRRAFGGPLRELQAVGHLLAEMATRNEAARLLVYRAATEYDLGGPGITKLASMAKVFATETAQFVVDAAVQIHGARGLERGHLLEHLYREVRAPRIYEGASEVQRSVIARELYR